MYNSTFNYTLNLYALDKKNLQLNKIETIADRINSYTLINLNNNSLDFFIYCFSNSSTSNKCLTAKYNNNKLYLNNSIKVFSCQCTKNLENFQKNYAILSNQRIAIICHSTASILGTIYLTILQYADNNIMRGSIFNKLIMEEYYSTNIHFPSIIYNLNKGLILYHIREKYLDISIRIIKSYIEESCSSFEIMTNELVKTKIYFSNYISGGLNNSDSNFQITEIDPKILLFYNKTIITAGNTIYKSSNLFYFTSLYSYNPLIIKFKIPKNAIIHVVQLLIFFIIKYKSKINLINVIELLLN